jgi:hypothetical protein
LVDTPRRNTRFAEREYEREYERDDVNDDTKGRTKSSLSETCVSARSINQRYSNQSSSSLSKDLKRKQQRTTTTTTTDVRLQSGAILSKRETTEREGEASARLAEIVLPRTATTATARGGGTRTRTETIFLEEDEGD